MTSQLVCTTSIVHYSKCLGFFLYWLYILQTSSDARGLCYKYRITRVKVVLEKPFKLAGTSFRSNPQRTLDVWHNAQIRPASSSPERSIEAVRTSDPIHEGRFLLQTPLCRGPNHPPVPLSSDDSWRTGPCQEDDIGVARLFFTFSWRSITPKGSVKTIFLHHFASI